MQYSTREAEAAAYGVSTLFDAGGRTGLIDLDLIAHVPEAKVAGRARTVFCGQDDNLMVPAAIAHAEPGDVLVMRMPESRPVSLLGELLATQCLARGVVAVLVDAAIRDALEHPLGDGAHALRLHHQRERHSRQRGQIHALRARA